MTAGVLYIVLLAVSASYVESQTLTTYWEQPPSSGRTVTYADNAILSLRSQFQLEWVTFMDEYSIWLWQQDLTRGYAYSGNPVFTKTAAQNETGHSTWIVDNQSFDLNKSNVFFFALGPNVTLADAFTSHYFNLSAVVPTTTTSLLQTATSSGSSNASTTSIPGTPAAATSSVSNSNAASERTGLGVGLGVALPLVLILAAFLGWKIRRSRREQNAPQHQQETLLKSTTRGADTHPQFGKVELSSDVQIEPVTATAQGPDEPYELPAR